METYAKQYGYHGALKRIATTKTVDGEGVVTCSDRKDFFPSWNKIDMETVQKISTETWGTKNWEATEDKVIQPLLQARGEISGSNLTNKEKKMYMLRWRYHILANKCKNLLTAPSREILKSNESL